MKTYRFSIQPKTAFATAIKGDTLFGQICWAIVQRHGTEKLTDCLSGYLTGEPFLIVSDAFWHRYLPRPKIPTAMLGFDLSDNRQRKLVKSKQWLPEDKIITPVNTWHNSLFSEKELASTLSPDEKTPVLLSQFQQYHNTINRISNATGEDMFAPYSVHQWVYHPNTVLDIYIVLDETKLTLNELNTVLQDCGYFGYGKDATTGLGKFEIIAAPTAISNNPPSKHYLTLAPSVLPSEIVDTEETFYSVFTRFGKHGQSAVLSGKPFKNPVLMADSAAFVTFKTTQTCSFIGCGLNQISNAMTETVQQAYSPVFALNYSRNTQAD